MDLWDEIRERNVARAAEFFADLRERRIFRMFLAYLAAGWLALQGADQLASRDIVSELAYRLVLVVYLAGMPASLIVGWFHGEKGAQRLTALEAGLLAVVAGGTVAAGGAVIEAHETSPETLTEASGLDLHRVAVTYFEDVSAERDLEAVAEGLSESLMAKLGGVAVLDVVSRHAVGPFRGGEVPPDSVARALGAGTVITGSVDGNGDRLRITLKLVDGNSGAVVARRVVSSSRSELLATRDSVAEELGRQLRRWLGEEITYRAERSRSNDVTAWVLTQRGERLVRQGREAARRGQADTALARFRTADSLLARAEAADSAWVAPTVDRARVAYRTSRALAEVTGDRHGAVQAATAGLEHAERALSRDAMDPGALELRGTLRYWMWLLGFPSDPEQRAALLDSARRDLEAAVDADPNLASAYSTLSHLRYQPDVSDLAGVVLAARRAYEADAYLQHTDAILARLVSATLDLGQFRQAERWCGEGRRRFPADHRFRLCSLQLMASPAVSPSIAAAWAHAAAVDSLAPAAERPLRRAEARMLTAGVLARAGLRDSAEAVLDRVGGELPADEEARDHLLGVEAYVRTLLGQDDRAVGLLRRYVAAHPGHEFGVAGEISWRWRELQGHPDFRELRASEEAAR